MRKGFLFVAHKKRVELLLLFILSLSYIIFHFYQIGEISNTLDETTDLNSVNCYVRAQNGFSCREDISQTRFPYYIHASVQSLTHNVFGRKLHFIISLLFGLFILLYMYFFAKKEFGAKVAFYTAMLMALSIPLLASSRMVLTHSEIIFTTFSVLTVTTLYTALTKNSYRTFLLAAVFFGLSLSSAIIGIFLFVWLVIVYILFRAPRKAFYPKDLLFIPLAVTVFFTTSFAYTDPHIFSAFIKDILVSRVTLFPEWNYMQLGSPSSPWWYSWLLFFVKVTPWWGAMYIISIILIWKNNYVHEPQRTFLYGTAIFVLLFLFMKSTIFHYDAPHHHLFFYPFVYLAIAVGIVTIQQSLKRRGLHISFNILIVFFFLLQMRDIYTFFPNYLFYGAQYGSNFIGEFYGPAVLHCQDQNAINNVMKKLSSQGQNLLVLNKSCFQAHLPHTYFPDYIVGTTYYAYVDYVHAYHYTSEDVVDYKKFISRTCTPYYSYNFPLNTTVYWLYKCVE